MTGTKIAHFPKSIPLSKNYDPAHINADYEPWSP